VSSHFRALGQNAAADEPSGEPLCLAFTNTVHEFGATPLDDDLRSYADLLAWARTKAVVEAATGRKLAAAARRDPRAADTALARARTLRKSMYRIFSARASGSDLPAADLTSVNTAIRSAMAGGELADDGHSFSWRWPAGSALDNAILWPIARSAAHLLTSPDLERVVECSGKTCTWLVLDTSKNHSRKFCSALGCGNRTRVRRHYERARAAKV
jgi:predicted RNA-binding Zn ribbon-like protein